MTNEQVLKELIIYIKNNNGMTNCFGHFEFKTSDIIGQGGNGVVYSATIDDKSVAIKFLLSTSSKKRRRFKSEFLNTNFVRNSLKQIVNMIHYDELKISDKLSIPYIIMNKYEKSLKTYREEIDSVNISYFNKLLNFLLTSIKSLHNKGILHRDIKPENILIDSDGEYLLSDFGIAHFDEEEFPIDNKTDKGERLANVEFSAPEQLCKGTVVNQTADIYSMAQILYWFVFKTVNRGTGGRHISEVIKDKDSYIYDNIIYQCIKNSPSDRFQSICEIEQYYKDIKYKEKEIDPFDDMREFSDAIRSIVPEFYNQVYCIENKDEIEKLLNSIFSREYNKSIEFNSGKGNNTINSFVRLENDDFLMDCSQINIIRAWGYLTSDVYDDILILELGKSTPYIINGIEHFAVAQVDNNELVPIKNIESGYVRYNGKVTNVKDINIQERYIFNDYNCIAIGPFHNCTIIQKNDNFMRELQVIERLTEQNILMLKKKIHMNRALDVELRL